MRLQVKKWFALILLISVVLILCLHIIDRAIHCKSNGLTRDEALRIANWKLGVQFKNNPLLSQFKLVADQFESDKSWIFTYHADDCTTDIIIDKCGVADVGGLSGGCLSRQGNGIF